VAPVRFITEPRKRSDATCDHIGRSLGDLRGIESLQWPVGSDGVALMARYRRASQSQSSSGVPRQLSRAIGRLVKRHWSWVVGLTALAVGAVALYVELNPGGQVTPEQQELLSNIPPKVGWHCHPLAGDGPILQGLTDRIEGRAECEATDAGPEELTFFSFVSQADERRYLRALEVRRFQEGFLCKATYLSLGEWVDRRGTAGGEILCADGPRHASLVWSDASVPLPMIGYASAQLADEQALHRWWQHDVKDDGGGTWQAATSQLQRSLPPGFGSCSPSAVIQAGAVAAVECRPGGGITSAGAALFPSGETLKNYLASEARATAGISRTAGCGISPLSYAPWWLGNHRENPRGMVLCYPNEGTQWMVWSTLRARVYAYASRADGRTHELWRRWSQSLCRIKSPNRRRDAHSR